MNIRMLKIFIQILQMPQKNQGNQKIRRKNIVLILYSEPTYYGSENLKPQSGIIIALGFDC